MRDKWTSACECSRPLFTLLCLLVLMRLAGVLNAPQAEAGLSSRAFAAGKPLKERPLAELSPDAASYLSEQGGDIGLAVVDPARRSLYLANGKRRYQLDSVVKLPIMLTVLNRAQLEERALSDWELEQLEAMITVSDNDAADLLWIDLGGASAVRNYVRPLGLRNIHLDRVGRWGDSQASARDLAILLEYVLDGITLDQTGRDLALDLMSRVTEQQRWGVADSLGDAPGETRVGLKNGWWPDESGWQLNSVGFVVPGDTRQPYAMAILSRDMQSLDQGIETIDELARLIHRAELELCGEPVQAARP